MPGTPRIHSAPRSTRPSRPSTSVTSNGPAVRSTGSAGGLLGLGRVVVQVVLSRLDVRVGGGRVGRSPWIS